MLVKIAVDLNPKKVGNFLRWKNTSALKFPDHLLQQFSVNPSTLAKTRISTNKELLHFTFIFDSTMFSFLLGNSISHSSQAKKESPEQQNHEKIV